MEIVTSSVSVEIPNFRKDFDWYYTYAEIETKKFIFDVLDSGKTFVDIGADVGTHTIIAGFTKAKVYAIEANNSNFEMLQKNVKVLKLLLAIHLILNKLNTGLVLEIF